MADQTQSIRDLFGSAGVAISQSDVWSVQGTPVVKHKALERLAAGMKIEFRAPQFLRTERDEAVILVTGQLPNCVTEWSIGEAVVNVNYRVTGKMAAYVYAMAEKRAKDRVILKLAGLHGVYSEEEADEFKNASGPTMTELLTAAETQIDAAAKDGLPKLEATWKALSPDLKPALKTKVTNLVNELKAKAA